jgi:hypothetical protein
VVQQDCDIQLRHADTFSLFFQECAKAHAHGSGGLGGGNWHVGLANR